MADARFSFQEKGKNYHPQWMSPESLTKHPKTLNTKAADMWSFAVLLWELSTREMPFPELSPMEAGMKVWRYDRVVLQGALVLIGFCIVQHFDIYYVRYLLFQIATEGLRLEILPGISNHMAKFIRICMNEDPGKRPTFEQVLPILDKMRK